MPKTNSQEQVLDTVPLSEAVSAESPIEDAPVTQVGAGDDTPGQSPLATSLDQVHKAISAYNQCENERISSEAKAAEASARAREYQEKAEGLQLAVVEAEQDALPVKHEMERLSHAVDLAEDRHQEALLVLEEAKKLVEKTAQEVRGAQYEYRAACSGMVSRVIRVHAARLEYDKFCTMASNESFFAQKQLVSVGKRMSRARLEVIEAKTKLLALPDIADIWSDVAPLLEDNTSVNGGDN